MRGIIIAEADSFIHSSCVFISKFRNISKYLPFVSAHGSQPARSKGAKEKLFSFGLICHVLRRGLAEQSGSSFNRTDEVHETSWAKRASEAKAGKACSEYQTGCYILDWKEEEDQEKGRLFQLCRVLPLK